MNKIFLGVLIFLFFIFFPIPVFAKGEFTSSYQVSYDVFEDGQTEVIENITLKNLTDKFYPSSFTLTIAATQLTDVEAYDADSTLETVVENMGKKSQITVKFIKQFSGKGKEYKWTLKFKSKDFAQKVGNVWQISVPKINQVEDVDKYQLHLLVPVSFGEPTVLLPTPNRQIENAGKLQLTFGKAELQDVGVLAYFGDHQMIDFTLKYNLENKTILPKTFAVGLPADSQYQKVMISAITPKPEDVSYDGDGNIIAFFRLDRRQTIQAEVTGSAKLFATPRHNITLSEEQKKIYLKPQKYWESESPQLKARLDEIVSKEITVDMERMEKIHRFVSSNLQFDSSRLTETGAVRLGALTVISNPQKALGIEFSDLTVALARSANIPTRQVLGVGISNNHDLRPLSFQGKKMHSWVEYFDQDKGWLPTDPTWENTSGGIDYFTKPDLAHFSIVRRGVSSTLPEPPSDVETTVIEKEFDPQGVISLKIDIPDIQYASFPSKLKIRVENTGNTYIPPSKLSLSAGTLQFVQKGSDEMTKNLSFDLAEIPPYGVEEFEYGVKTGTISLSYEDDILFGVNDQIISKKVIVKPFYTSTPLIFAVVSATLLILAVYILVLGLHLRISQSGITFTLEHRKKR